MSAANGIRVRHKRRCASKADDECNCKPSYEAFVYSPRDKTKIRKTFATKAAARAWRAEASTAVRKGQLRTPTTTTVREAWEAWLSGARDGTVRTRSGDVYKPSAIHGYEQVMKARVLHDFGARRLSELSRLDLQDFADSTGALTKLLRGLQSHLVHSIEDAAMHRLQTVAHIG